MFFHVLVYRNNGKWDPDVCGPSKALLFRAIMIRCYFLVLEILVGTSYFFTTLLLCFEGVQGREERGENRRRSRSSGKNGTGLREFTFRITGVNKYLLFLAGVGCNQTRYSVRCQSLHYGVRDEKSIVQLRYILHISNKALYRV